MNNQDIVKEQTDGQNPSLKKIWEVHNLFINSNTLWLSLKCPGYIVGIK